MAATLKNNCLRRWPLLLTLALFAFLYAALVLLRHAHFDSHAYDLGIFDQAIWHYSRFEAPASTVLGIRNLLGDHFHPILVLAAPLYWLWHDVRVLLLLQVALFVAAAVPIYLLAEKYFGRWSAVCWSAAYLAFWGVQNAVNFDFHEIAFAMPLLALGAYFFVLKKYGWCAAVVLPLLLVKEDLSLVVVTFGLLLLWRRQWRLGALLTLGGAMWFEVVTKFIMPIWAFGGQYNHWTYDQLGATPAGVIKTTILHPRRVLHELLNPYIKVNTYYMLFSPWLFLSLGSVLVITMIPLLAERFLSTSLNYWVPDFHYNATIAPLLAIGGIEGLHRLGRWLGLRRPWLAAVCTAVLASNLYLGWYFPLNNVFHAGYWRLSANDKIGTSALAVIPSRASVVAQDSIVPHLTHRQKVYQLVPGVPAADYVIANYTMIHFPVSDTDYKKYLTALSGRDYRLVFSRGAWLVYAKGNGSSVQPDAQTQAYFAAR